MTEQEWAGQIFQVVCAVENLDRTLENWRRIVDFDQDSIRRGEDAGVRYARFDLGGVEIRLEEPLDKEGDYPCAVSLRRRGPGFHHLGIAVRSREALCGRYAALGLHPVFVEKTAEGEAPLYDLDERLGMSLALWDHVFGPCARLEPEDIGEVRSQRS